MSDEDNVDQMLVEFLRSEWDKTGGACVHPLEAQVPLPYMGRPADPKEWECLVCGTWQMKERVVFDPSPLPSYALPEDVTTIPRTMSASFTVGFDPAISDDAYATMMGSFVQAPPATYDTWIRLPDLTNRSIFGMADQLNDLFFTKMPARVRDDYEIGLSPDVYYVLLTQHNGTNFMYAPSQVRTSPVEIFGVHAEVDRKLKSRTVHVREINP